MAKVLDTSDFDVVPKGTGRQRSSARRRNPMRSANRRRHLEERRTLDAHVALTPKARDAARAVALRTIVLRHRTTGSRRSSAIHRSCSSTTAKARSGVSRFQGGAHRCNGRACGGPDRRQRDIHSNWPTSAPDGWWRRPRSSPTGMWRGSSAQRRERLHVCQGHWQQTDSAIDRFPGEAGRPERLNSPIVEILAH